MAKSRIFESSTNAASEDLCNNLPNLPEMKERGTKRWNPAQETKREPISGAHPVIKMILHLGEEKHPVQVLLDTGCSVPLINQQTAARLQIPLEKH